MGSVNADYSAINEAWRNIRNAIDNIEKTRSSLSRKYQQLGAGWKDSKFRDLGQVVRECTSTLTGLEKNLVAGEKQLVLLMKAIQEYEAVSLGGTGNSSAVSSGSSADFDSSNAEVSGPVLTRHLSPEEVNAGYQSGLSDINEMISNYKEALMDRGVPEGYWLTLTLAKHKAAMMEQLGYDLDLASGHAQDTVHNSDAYHYPGDYRPFYDQLANEFQTFCLAENNPNYQDGIVNEWSVNCQRCAPTYEMQRRGMDVTAQPCTGDDTIAMNPFSVWQSPQVISCSGVGASEIESAMQSWGDGSRAQVVVAWTPYEGHTFIAEQIDGQTHYIDPQSGNECYSDWVDSALPGYTQFCRIDTLEPSDMINYCYTEVQR